MKLFTKNGKRVLTLNEYGYRWGKTYVNGGCDEANIDTGDSAAFEDFFTYLQEESDLDENSIKELKTNFWEDRNWALEVEDGAGEALLENGYEEADKNYFVRKEEE